MKNSAHRQQTTEFIRLHLTGRRRGQGHKLHTRTKPAAYLHCLHAKAWAELWATDNGTHGRSNHTIFTDLCPKSAAVLAGR